MLFTRGVHWTVNQIDWSLKLVILGGVQSEQLTTCVLITFKATIFPLEFEYAFNLESRQNLHGFQATDVFICKKQILR